jgi:hypothetical protein
MKLYYFNPNNYGDEFFVMSSSPDAAKNALMDYFNRIPEKDKWHFEYFIESLKKGILPNGFTIEEYEKNVVIKSEIA